jgi:pimeloyl-ACP methyl ester carboxylesterase
VTRWVLLRGLSREQAHWGDFAPLLARQLDPADSVLMLDLPGTGALCGQASPWQVEAMAQACRAQLARLAPAPAPGARTVLLGLSMGGMVALAWAQAWPQEVTGLVLVNSSLRRLSTAPQRLRWAALPGLLGWLLAQLRGDGLAAEQAILRLTSAQPARHAGVLPAWCAVRRARPVPLRTVLRQLVAAARYRGPAQAPALPLLVASSAGDRLVAPACSARIAAQWQAAACCHPWAGHDLPLDDGHWLAGQVAAWWQTAAAGGSPGRTQARPARADMPGVVDVTGEVPTSPTFRHKPVHRE